MTRYVGWMVVSLIGLTTACNTFQPVRKQQARTQWDQVRSRVKLQLAHKQYAAGHFEASLRTAVEAVALDASEVEVYSVIARSHLQLDQPASAMRAIERAETMGLQSADLHYLRGLILEQRGDIEAAMKQYIETRRLDPMHADALLAQAQCLVALDESNEALKLLREQMDRIDDDGSVAALASHVALLTGDKNEALHWLRRAHAANRNDALIAEEMGRLLLQAGRYEEVLSALNPILDSQADSVTNGGGVRRSIALAHLGLGNHAAAGTVLTPYLRAHPKDAYAQLLLAKAAVAANDITTALQAVDQARQLDPDQPELWLVRAALYWKRGESVRAAADLYDLLQNHPDDVEAHCLLAEVLRDQNKHEAAQTYFQQALMLNPRCAWASEGLKALRNHPPDDAQPPSAKLTAAEVNGLH